MEIETVPLTTFVCSRRSYFNAAEQKREETRTFKAECGSKMDFVVGKNTVKAVPRYDQCNAPCVYCDNLKKKILLMLTNKN